MNPVRITLESLRLSAAQPSSWVIWGLIFLVWPLWTGAASIGISSQSSSDWLILYNLAIASFAVGALRGIGVVARLSKSIAQISSGPSLTTHLLAVGSVGLLHVWIASTPALMFGTLQSESGGSDLGLRLALVFLVVVALGALILRVDLAVGSAPWLLGIALLLAPILLPDPLPARSLLLLAGAMLSASWLLDHPPGRTT